MKNVQNIKNNKKIRFERKSCLLHIIIVYGKGWGVVQRFDELSDMLINRFREDDVQVTGQKLNCGGARFEIFFNGQCVFSKVEYDILFDTLEKDYYAIYTP